MFPSILPVPEAQLLIQYLRGDGTVDLRAAGYAVWMVQGYAMGVALGQPGVSGTVLPPADDVALADCIEAHVVKKGDSKAIPWAILLPLLMSLLERFLPKK